MDTSFTQFTKGFAEGTAVHRAAGTVTATPGPPRSCTTMARMARMRMATLALLVSQFDGALGLAAASGPGAAYRLRVDGANTHPLTGSTATRFAIAARATPTYRLRPIHPGGLYQAPPSFA